MSEASPILLSVSITAYNHEPFIAQCLESVLNQKTNFEFEILLGEDNSSDKTREICVQYAEKYPDRIRLFLHSRDSVIFIDGSPTGRHNLLNNLVEAKGKYIAMTDGDDYWTNEFKLQTQVDFLEANPGYSTCFHNSLIVDTMRNEEKKFLVNGFKETSSTSDLAKSNFIPTSSVVFRNYFKGNYPDWFSTFPAGDWAIHLLNSLQGKIYYINEIWSVYRFQQNSVWRSKSEKEQLMKIECMYDTLIEKMPSNFKRDFVGGKRSVSERIKKIEGKNQSIFIKFWNKLFKQ